MKVTFSNRHWFIATIPVLLGAIHFLRPSTTGLWTHTLLEWGHTAVFGLIALALFAWMPNSWPDWKRAGVALLASLALAVLSEAAQYPIQRDASWEDIISDASGAVSFLLLALAVCLRRSMALPSFLLGLAILVWTAVPLINVSAAYVHRNVNFPVIFAGDIEAEKTFVREKRAVSRTAWDAGRGRPFTRLHLVDGPWPGVEIHDLYPDWSAYSSLLVDIEVENAAPFDLTVRVHDEAHRRGDQPAEDRFKRTFTLESGRTQLIIPLEDIEAAPETRPMNMTKIRGMILYSAEEYQRGIIRLYEIRLE